MKFPKPFFDDLLLNYETDTSSAHHCPRINPSNTCAYRMSEALVIANGLAKNDDEIQYPPGSDPKLRTSGLGLRGNGSKYLLGKYGYKGNLCPHGIARGAWTLANFLKQHWGTPIEWSRATLGVDKATASMEGASSHQMRETLMYGFIWPNLMTKTGLLSFYKIHGYSGEGHIDLWNKTAAVGHAYWDAKSVWFWEIE